jgi:tetratricopeptide (TPR) repeat protein
MRYNDSLEDLTEAIPLNRVSSVWRLLAVVFGILLLAVAILAVPVILALGLHQLRNARMPAMAPMVGTPAPPPAVISGTMGAGAAGVDLPYPVQQDLQTSDAPAPRTAGTRDAILQKGQLIVSLTGPNGAFPGPVAVAPSGDKMAYFHDVSLYLGPMGAPQIVQGFVFSGRGIRAGQISGTVFTRRGPGGAVISKTVPPAGTSQVPAERPPRGDEGYEPVSWSSDGRFVYCVDPMSSQIGRYDIGTRQYQGLPFSGTSPSASIGADVVFIRSYPRPKVGDPDAQGLLDPTEVVRGDWTTGQVAVLIPAKDITWTDVVRSPDDKRLVLRRQPPSSGQPPHPMIFLWEQGGEPKPLAIPGHVVGPPAWTPDGNGLVYARRAGGTAEADVDLYLWDIPAGRELRLTSGGGFSSPGITAQGMLFFLVANRDSQGRVATLYRASLADLKTAAGQATTPGSDAWPTLIERVTKGAGLTPDMDGSRLTAEVRAKVLGAFNRSYKELFKADPPGSAAAFDRERHNLESLKLTEAAKTHGALLLGVVEGEFLCRQHHGAWDLSAGSLWTASGKPLLPPDSLFAVVVNPFRPLQPSTASPPSLAEILRLAEGRILILANDPAHGQAAAAAKADSDLEKAVALYQQAKGTDADQMLITLAKRHENNYHLALHVAQILFENGRRSALRQVMLAQCALKPNDARKFNYLGLGLLRPGPDDPLDTDADSQRAIDAFKNALRCDLKFGAAYLNLADAYIQVQNLPAAVQCLDRYLELMPNGPYARDARLRLRAWEAKEGG